MLERVIVVAVLFVVGVAVYRLFAQSKLRQASAAAQRDTVLQAFRPGVPAIVYFASETCGPCKTMQAPALNELQRELGDRVQVFRVDAEQDCVSAERWGVFSVPTTFILDGHGEPKQVNHGVADAAKLRRQLETVKG
jgi:thioredoxin 1